MIIENYEELVDQLKHRLHPFYPLIVVIRGPQGAGKTTLAKRLCKDFEELTWMSKKKCAHFETDDYFMKDNVYAWDPNTIAEAHEWCQKEFKKIAKRSDGKYALVVVSNVSYAVRHVDDYAQCIKKGLRPCVVIRLKNVHENEHGVPKDVVEAVQAKFEPYPGELVVEGDL